jgi:hypothetical protein
VFYLEFVPAIVGKRLFAYRINKLPENQEIATVSDEALALLGLENGIDRWDDIFKNSTGEIRIVPRDEPYPEDWTSTVLTKYTGTSKTDPTITRNTDDKRWSQKGIERFNELRKLIITDRAHNPNFMKKLMDQERNRVKRKQAEGLKDDDSAGVIDADDDLFNRQGGNVPLTQARQTHGVGESTSEEDD